MTLKARAAGPAPAEPCAYIINGAEKQSLRLSNSRAGLKLLYLTDIFLTILYARVQKHPSAMASCSTGRMAPMLYYGIAAFELPVVCIESRQAHQALKSLATHKTDRNDARGLAHLACTGFFKTVPVKSLPAHAVQALMIARTKLVGQRVMLENQIRGLAVVFGIHLSRGP